MRVVSELMEELIDVIEAFIEVTLACNCAMR
jgi:hypothetical protein